METVVDFIQNEVTVRVLMQCVFSFKPRFMFTSCFDVFKALESLSLADSRLKSDAGIVINALGGNTSLTELDIRLAYSFFK